jgi:hypothetical protein
LALRAVGFPQSRARTRRRCGCQGLMFRRVLRAAGGSGSLFGCEGLHRGCCRGEPPRNGRPWRRQVRQEHQERDRGTQVASRMSVRRRVPCRLLTCSRRTSGTCCHRRWEHSSTASHSTRASKGTRDRPPRAVTLGSRVPGPKRPGLRRSAHESRRAPCGARDKARRASRLLRQGRLRPGRFGPGARRSPCVLSLVQVLVPNGLPNSLMSCSVRQRTRSSSCGRGYALVSSA